MRHHAIDQLRTHAHVQEAAPLASREERLRRWADLLRKVGARPLRPLMWVEFYSGVQRSRLRRDDSPISVAYADPVMRAAGLQGDTLGDAQLFFGLSDDEAHELLCDCHYRGAMTGRTAGHRIRALARSDFVGRVVSWLRGG